MLNKTTLAALAVIGGNTLAFAHGETMHLFLDNGVPAMGLRDETSQVTKQRAFQGTFTWNAALNAYSTSSPGWTWSDEWEPSDELGFNVLTSVQRWDGAQFVNAGQQFRISLEGKSIDTTGGYNAGFFTVIGADDHKHFRYTLLGVAQGDLDTAVYRINLEGIRHEHHDHDIRYPGFGLVLNRGASQESFNAAYDYALRNPVPEPVTLASLVTTIAAMLRRRR
ncbi:MAG: PEP-CTERM sorting domain-containing protein [Fimbriimonadaceae bacterium]|nr:PEP-CTERM sorting domain-containing protein [Fimbriimonadaceae bacterium]QYK54819.1 MAG: PEP-CTERM sorting domain-containing protein [Fimbriimonadaceae bacterium]